MKNKFLKLFVLLTFVMSLIVIPNVADAATYGIYTYTTSGDKVTITDCDTSASGAIVIPSEIEGKKVTSIGREAFYNCISLTTITIPESVTSIGYYAFYGCTRLTSITIPDSVTSIGGYAFEYCISLTSITIPDSVTSIGSSAFSDCKSLTSITIPDSVTSIGRCAFSGCTSLTSITIPDSVTSIGDYAFYCCESLTSITIPDSVTSIGDYAFYYCESLTSIMIPESATSIGEWAFCNCESLTSIIIPDSVTSIGDYAFYWCKSLISIMIPESATSIGDYAFCSCISLTSIIIPDSVTSIGDDAFYNCTSLTSITIPDSVTSIGSYAFYSCSNLKDVYISDIDAWCGIYFSSSSSNPLYNGAKLYLDGNLVTEVVLPDSVTSIGDYAFYYCEFLTSITIPDSVTSIGREAFYGCNNLKDVYISDIDAWCGIEFGGYEANPLCNGANLYLDGNLLMEVVLPESVTSIGDYAFYYCEFLTSITIPESVTSIGWEAFSCCESLTSITIPDSVTSIEYGTFYNCTSLTSITIPDSVTSIGNGAFSGCTSLTTITIPDSVTSIGNGAFYNCESLTTITIPESVTSIGDGAFRYCTSLKTVMYGGREEDWNALKASAGEGNEILFNAEVRYLISGDFDKNIISVEPDCAGAEPGDTNVAFNVKIAISDDVQNAILYVKYPSSMELKNVTSPFDYVEIQSETKDGEYTVSEIAFIYSFVGDSIPTLEYMNILNLYFDISKSALPGTATVEITNDSVLMGEEDFSFDVIERKTLQINPKLAQSISIVGNTQILEPTKYEAVVYPDYTTDKSVTWSVDDETIATITNDGYLIPVKSGTVTVTAKSVSNPSVYATKTVYVTKKADISSVTSDIGYWIDSFESSDYDYEIIADSNVTEITFTTTFTGGMLKINGSTAFSGRTKTIPLTDDVTTITFERTNVANCVDSVYTITVVKSDESMITEKISENKINITFNKSKILPFEKAVLLAALYDETGKLLDIVPAEVAKEDKYAEIEIAQLNNCAECKLMLWDAFSILKPVCEYETVEGN